MIVKEFIPMTRLSCVFRVDEYLKKRVQSCLVRDCSFLSILLIYCNFLHRNPTIYIIITIYDYHHFPFISHCWYVTKILSQLLGNNDVI